MSVMPYFLLWCLLLGSFGVVLAGKEIVAYRGMSIPLFPNVSVDDDVSVYINGKGNSKLIARLQIGNGIVTSHWWIDPEYSSKIYIEKNRSIWLCELNQTDARTYYILYGVDTRGPEVNLTILDAMEENHLDVCRSSHPNTEKYFGRLTEVQIGEEIRKWLHDHPEYVRKYLEKLTEEQIGEEIPKWLYNHPEYFKTYFGKVMPEQILQMLCNHPQEVLEEPTIVGTLTKVQQLATCILYLIIFAVFLYKVHQNWNHIRERWISVKHWFQKKSSQHRRSENLPQNRETAINIEVEVPENLTEDQIWEWIQKWQDVYPGLFMKKFLGTLKEDQVHKWLNDHPEFLENYLDQSGIGPTYPPTLEDLAVTTNEVDNEMENDQSPFFGQGKLTSPNICSNSSSEQPENHKLPLTPVDAGTERKANQGQLVSSKGKLVTSQTGISPNSDQPENDHLVFKTAHSQLSHTPMDARTERKDNQMKWISSEDKLVTSQTGISPISDIFSEPGHSDIQPFNKDEQDANPEGDMAQTDVKSLGVLLKEDSDSLPDEESREPLLMDYGDQKLRCDKRKPSTQYKKSPD